MFLQNFHLFYIYHTLTKVNMEHKKWPKLVQNRIKALFLSKKKSLGQRLKASAGCLHRPYLLVVYKGIEGSFISRETLCNFFLSEKRENVGQIPEKKLMIQKY